MITSIICFPGTANAVGVVKRDLKLIWMTAQIFTFSHLGDMLEKTCCHSFYFMSFKTIQSLDLLSFSFTQVFINFVLLLCTELGSIDNLKSFVFYSLFHAYWRRLIYRKGKAISVLYNDIQSIRKSITQILWNRVHHRRNSAKINC